MDVSEIEKLKPNSVIKIKKDTTLFSYPLFSKHTVKYDNHNGYSTITWNDYLEKIQNIKENDDVVIIKPPYIEKIYSSNIILVDIFVLTAQARFGWVCIEINELELVK